MEGIEKLNNHNNAIWKEDSQAVLMDEGVIQTCHQKD